MNNAASDPAAGGGASGHAPNGECHGPRVEPPAAGYGVAIENAMQAYRLGGSAGNLLIHKPRGWKRKIKDNIREAAKLGINIDPKAFNDLVI